MLFNTLLSWLFGIILGQYGLLAQPRCNCLHVLLGHALSNAFHQTQWVVFTFSVFPSLQLCHYICWMLASNIRKGAAYPMITRSVAADTSNDITIPIAIHRQFAAAL